MALHIEVAVEDYSYVYRSTARAVYTGSVELVQVVQCL